jgi:hypothetical protein
LDGFDGWFDWACEGAVVALSFDRACEDVGPLLPVLAGPAPDWLVAVPDFDVSVGVDWAF